ncbi:zinc finger and BTB domain-containing protein 24-like isoform X2 [Macrobrachium rosenbergii]|uniref:zinc finger and BTB domain-containing protein 24-like isoform X2 n=1 Tax=Macrobrachium rosenbergii TaxID=79674 RepID=UPI0034D56A11
MGDGMLSLSWNNHKATFCHILANLRDKERYTDVTLACEGKFYRVHKLVLSTCSEYFEVMFENTPCKHPVIVLNHIKHDEIEALLSYMYAGVVNVAQNDLARLIKAAELLKIKGLAVPDEPPQESEVRKSHPSPWSSRDERTSPLPKRRRKDDSGTPQGGSQTSNSPASSPRASPFMDNSDYGERSRTHSEGQVSDHRGERTDLRSDPLSTRLDDISDKQIDHRSSTEQSPAQAVVDETLVKEEILDTADDSRDNMLDSGLDYGSLGAENRLDSSNDASNTVLPNKFDTPMMPSQTQLSEPVVEALAGPSGMQGWLGDMGGGFSSVESFRGEGSQQDMRQPLPTQQPHQMVMGDSGDLATDRGKASERVPSSTSGSSTFRCPECPFTTSQYSLLERHLWTHSGGKEYTCPYCSYHCSKKENLKLHMRIHTGEKRFSCPHCPHQASTNSDLKKHIRTHTGEKPYSCPVCPHQAATSSDLKKHIRIHTGEKPYACPHCFFRCNQNSNLKIHLRTHDVVYKCPHCAYSTNNKTELQRHVQIHFGE